VCVQTKPVDLDVLVKLLKEAHLQSAAAPE